jgi:hypothetical protein
MLPPTPPIQGSAIFDGPYRYRLDRWWGLESKVCWIMHNPSKAGANIDDATVRIGIGFTRRWEFKGLIFVNVAALVSTDPKILLKHSDPYGPKNLDYIDAAIEESEIVVVAWGRACVQVAAVTDLLRRRIKPVYCLGINKDGSPHHPLRLKQGYATEREPFKV